jgi:hypothetical protein
MTEVTSSNLHAIGFDETTKTIAVHFKNGSIWHYPGANPALWDRFVAAESKGKFFNSSIKGKFVEAEMMTGECPACGDIGWIGDPCLDCGTQRYVRKERDGSSPRPRQGSEVR